MRFTSGSRRWCPLLAAFLLAAGACDDGGSAAVDGGADSGTDTDTDTDSDTDADAGPDGGGFVCEVDPERVFDDVAYLASEELAGREAGTEGNEAAMQDAEALFAELGLEPIGDDGTYRQAFMFQKVDLLEDPTVVLDGETLAFNDEYFVFDGTGSADVSAEVVFVGYGMTVPPYDPADYPDCPLPATGYDDYEGVDATGRIALVVRHGPADDDTVPDECPDNGLCGGAACLWNFGYKAENADLHGAVAMIMVQHDGGGSAPMPGTMGDSYIADFASVFVDRGVVEASLTDLDSWIDAIDGALTGNPQETGVEATISVATGAVDVSTANVIGAIAGTDPEIGDEVVIVGGHIDHLGTSGADVFYGADDNASGSAVTMELARMISQCAEPARTIVFALWNGEEDGLLGSIYYVADDPIYPLGSTVAAFSVDMVGVGNGTGIALAGTTDSQNSWLLDVMQGSAAEMGLGFVATAMEPVSGSDHYPFDYAGVPSAMATTLGAHPYYHTPADTIDTISVDDLEAAAALMYAGLKPLVEGTEEAYLPDGKGRALVPDPETLDHPKLDDLSR